jgi:hypothetical protein
VVGIVPSYKVARTDAVCTCSCPHSKRQLLIRRGGFIVMLIGLNLCREKGEMSLREVLQMYVQNGRFSFIPKAVHFMP